MPKKTAQKKTPVVEASIPQSRVEQPPKQKIVVEEKDALVINSEDGNLTQVEPEPKAKPTPEVQSVPTVDKDATLEIEKITKPEKAEKSKAVEDLKVPTVDINASLAIEENSIEDRIKKAVDKEDEPQSEKSGKRLYVLGAIALALIALGVFGFIFLFIQNPPGGKTAVVPVTKETTQASPSASLPVLVRADWTFEVLNGSGIAGSAKKAADKLEALGYKVISTDNAGSSDYTGNKLYVTAGMTGKADLLIADLTADFNIASVSGVLTDSTASARIIVGK